MLFLTSETHLLQLNWKRQIPQGNLLSVLPSRLSHIRGTFLITYLSETFILPKAVVFKYISNDQGQFVKKVSKLAPGIQV